MVRKVVRGKVGNQLWPLVDGPVHGEVDERPERKPVKPARQQHKHGEPRRFRCHLDVVVHVNLDFHCVAGTVEGILKQRP